MMGQGLLPEGRIAAGLIVPPAQAQARTLRAFGDQAPALLQHGEVLAQGVGQAAPLPRQGAAGGQGRVQGIQIGDPGEGNGLAAQLLGGQPRLQLHGDAREGDLPLQRLQLQPQPLDVLAQAFDLSQYRQPLVHVGGALQQPVQAFPRPLGDLQTRLQVPQGVAHVLGLDGLPRDLAEAEDLLEQLGEACGGHAQHDGGPRGVLHVAAVGLREAAQLTLGEFHVVDGQAAGTAVDAFARLGDRGGGREIRGGGGELCSRGRFLRRQ